MARRLRLPYQTPLSWLTNSQLWSKRPFVLLIDKIAAAEQSAI
jgi:hypothetical protein